MTVTGTLPSAKRASAPGDIFTPNKVTISQGGTVTWTFVGTTVHNVTFAAATSDAPQNISDNYATTVNRSFAAAGTFSYSCTNHAGMNGQVVVR